MIDCMLIDNFKFQEGGTYHKEIYQGRLEHYTRLDIKMLCPETGDIPINGEFGTTLWVIPKSNSAEYNIKNDVTPYLNNDLIVWLLSESFQIENYVNVQDTHF